MINSNIYFIKCSGVSKVPSRSELKEALDLAFRHDTQAVVEPCVSDGVEVTCTVHDITGDELLEVTIRCYLSKSTWEKQAFPPKKILTFMP